MKILVVGLLFIASFFPASAQTAHMLLSIGQSNAVAAGTAPTAPGAPATGVPFPGGWTPDPMIQIWYYPAQQWQTYNPGVNSDWAYAAWSMEAEYAREWRIDHPTEKLYIWKQAVYGTPLYLEGPSPSVPVWSPNSPTISQWVVLLQQVALAKAALVAQGLVPHIDSTIMFQGETDAQNGHGAEYYVDLLQFINVTRQILNAPDMHFDLVQILPPWPPDAGLVRQAQQMVGSLPGNSWVNIDAVETLTGSGGTHIDAVGAVQTGALLYAADKAIP